MSTHGTHMFNSFILLMAGWDKGTTVVWFIWSLSAIIWILCYEPISMIFFRSSCKITVSRRSRGLFSSIVSSERNFIYYQYMVCLLIVFILNAMLILFATSFAEYPSLNLYKKKHPQLCDLHGLTRVCSTAFLLTDKGNTVFPGYEVVELIRITSAYQCLWSGRCIFIYHNHCNRIFESHQPSTLILSIFSPLNNVSIYTI